MSLDKAILHGKEHRKPYRGGKAVANSCRNGGDCSFCKGNRLHRHDKKLEKAKSQLKEDLS